MRRVAFAALPCVAFLLPGLVAEFRSAGPQEPPSTRPTAPKGELLRNGGFEEAAEDQGPAGWTFKMHLKPRKATREVRIRCVEDPKMGGKRAAELDLSDAWSAARIVQTVTVGPMGAALRFEGSIRASDDYAGGIQFVVAKKAGMILDKPNRNAVFKDDKGVPLKASTKWEKFSHPFTCEDEGESEIQILFHGTGKVWLDDLSLKGAG
jgi:hypothetical protein